MGNECGLVTVGFVDLIGKKKSALDKRATEITRITLITKPYTPERK
jgi:hypothetical protein